jgi:hypothetical protein
MGCKHERIGCKDGVFFCVECGAVIPDPFAVCAEKVEQEPTKKPAAKRSRKGEGK